MHLKNMLKTTGYEKIILNAQSYAVPFYEKLGYVITSPEFMDADIPHRAMEKIYYENKKRFALLRSKANLFASIQL